MALEELDGLFSDITEADRATIKSILERNPSAASRLSQRETVYSAFVDGDVDKLAGVTATAQTVTQQPTTTVSSPAAVDMADLDRRLDERMGKIWDDPRLNERVEARAKAIAEQIALEAENCAGRRSAYLSDEIFTLRSRHREEYGKDLDRVGFEKFVNDNTGKYGSLTTAYEAFTETDRIQKIKDEAFKAGQAARATTEVSGVSQPGSTVASMFLKSNPMNTGVAASRGDALDAAAAAFRQLSGNRVN